MNLAICLHIHIIEMIIWLDVPMICMSKLIVVWLLFVDFTVYTHLYKRKVAKQQLTWTCILS